MNGEVGDFTISGILILITAFIWLVIDIWLLVKERETISQRMWLWSRYFGAITFITGMLCGHWFW